MIIRYALAITAAVLVGCASGEETPSASWCSEIDPFVSPGRVEGRLEVVEITDENAERIASESAELRSRIAVLVSTAPESVRADVDLVLNGSETGDVEAVNAAKEDVRAFVDRRC